MTSVDVSKWTNISPSQDDAAGRGYSRASILFSADPFVQMLSKNVIDSLLVALFSPGGLATNDGWHGLRVSNPGEVPEAVAAVFAVSPLMLVNDRFVAHVAGLVSKALFPQSSVVVASS